MPVQARPTLLPQPFKGTLIDGIARSRRHPTTFQVPSHHQVAALTPGKYVKVGIEFGAQRRGERFWVKLVAIKDNRLNGIIDNDLVYTDDHQVKCGDLIEFERRHILGLFPEG